MCANTFPYLQDCIYLYIYNRPPEDEPSSSKHVEYIKNLNINLEKAYFASLCCIIILKRTLQNKYKLFA
jgi:hypothetical protein